MYDIMSPHAADFIDDGEILATLKYSEEHKTDKELIDQILKKAAEYKGLSHREALVLLDCELPEENQKILNLAKEIKQKIYGNRIVMFAPLYLSNYCINGCTYCPYHAKNKHIPPEETHAGRNQGGSDRAAGYGSQASGIGNRGTPHHESAGICSGKYQNHLFHQT